MAVNYNPKIVTDGLVLYLDAGNTKSYPGSGTVWTDLSLSKTNGIIYNGPPYTTTNGGIFTFDGVNDYADFGNILASLTNLTLECWVNCAEQTITYCGILSKTLDNTNGYELRIATYTPTTSQIEFRYKGDAAGGGIFNATNGVWYHIVATGTSGAQRLYVNAVLNQTNSVVTTPDANTNSLVIGKLAYSNRYFKGSISNARVYNRALTATEIAQNFNATRGRFGI